MLFKKWILAIVNDGATKDLIDCSKIGITVKPKNISAIKGAVIELFNQYRKNELNIYYRNEKILKNMI